MFIGALKKVLGASYTFCIMEDFEIDFFCSLSYKIKIVMVRESRNHQDM